MRSISKYPFAALLMLSTGAYALDFDEGVAAFKAGDFGKAMEVWQTLANQDNAIAQNALGVMYQKGAGVPQDYAEAAKWFRLAADNGYVSAQSNLGQMYAMGKGVTQDLAEAAIWFTRAAQQ